MADEVKPESKDEKKEESKSQSSNVEVAKGTDGAKAPEAPVLIPKESKPEANGNGTSSKLVEEALERERKLKERVDRLETELQTVKSIHKKPAFVIFKPGILKRKQ